MGVERLPYLIILSADGGVGSDRVSEYLLFGHRADSLPVVCDKIVHGEGNLKWKI